MGNGIAYALATTYSYTVNTRWTFSARWSWETVFRFLFSSGVIMLISMLIAKLADMAGLPPVAGIVCIVLTAPLLAFFIHRNWTYI